MQVATRESALPARPEVKPTARRRLARSIVICVVSLVALAAITIGIAAYDAAPRPVVPGPASVDGSDPINTSVVPFSVDGSAVVDGTSGVDG